MKYCLVILAFLSILTLTSCGGGGGSEPAASSPTPTPTPTPISAPILTPIGLILDETAEELKVGYWDYAQSLYKGSTAPATLNEEVAQELARFLLSYSPYLPPLTGARGGGFYSGLINPALEGGYACRTSGSIRFSSPLVPFESNNTSFEFDQCDNGYGVINGTGILVATKADIGFPYNGFNGAVFFDQVSYSERRYWLGDGSYQVIGEWQITGYISENYIEYAYVEPETEHKQQYIEQSVKLLYENVNTGAQYLHLKNYKAVPNVEYPRDIQHVYSGSLHIENAGVVAYERESYYYVNQYNVSSSSSVVNFTGDGDSRARFDYSLGLPSSGFTFRLGRNDEASFDVGNFFLTLDYFLENDFLEVPLVSVDEIKYPPFFLAEPQLATGQATSITDDIEVLFKLYDSDTPEEDIKITYVWSKHNFETFNNGVIAGQTSKILPAGSAEPGDYVSVLVTLFDGTYTRSSRSGETQIWDPPSK